ncbi:hypothetical protein A6A40_20965 (plasmid) [Azospirillum humicireducens]|uniref:Uncharacterized protein n=1 Tax=Azospirillum humicireducens TaxID=1226968 RepID=A0A2R4VST4_9PROT|nr:hypothetical protein [Azospirillum humicireducens]AWB07499.1 hypothetical protein A6A40_20965 [Azospirillum humicireducens]
MKTFSFAHLNPFGRSKAADGETQAGTDTTKAGTGDDADQQDETTPKDGEEDQTPGNGDGGDKNAGSQQAAAPGERERCAAIFAAPAAAGRVQLAAHLAFNTDLTVEAACAALEAAPIGATAPGASTPTGNPLALAAMDAHPNPTVGASTDTGSLSDDEKAAAAVLSSMAAVGLIAKKDGTR